MVYSPFIGPNGFSRSSGRIRRLNETSFEAKHPVLLDGRHYLVKLIARYLHHQSFDYMRAAIQSRFAVLKLRSTLCGVENSCVPCQKRKAKRVNSMISDLPLEHLGYRKPAFCYCGVDYLVHFMYLSVGAQRSGGFFSLLSWRHDRSILKLNLLWMAILASWVLRGSLPAKELR